MTARRRQPLVLSLLSAIACTHGPKDPEETRGFAMSDDLAIVIEDGKTQAIYPYDSAIRETIFVEAQMDSDGDGALDRIAIEIVRPKSEPGRRMAVVMEASPYYGFSTEARHGLPVPLGHHHWFSEYFVARGYAAVEVEMQGTSRSDGCPSAGGKEDTASAVAAIDWLNGRARGFREDGTEAFASWSTGAVGMIGVSYNGTLPIAAAAQGTPGLKTIVPIAAISSWYDYARDHGIGYYPYWSDRYPQGLATIVASPAARKRCAAALEELGKAAADDTFDYTPFWADRNYRTTDDAIRASVLLVHGLSDSNVKPGHFSRLWYDLQARGVPAKLWLHREGHADPVYLRRDEWVDTVHRWMDHWLYDIDNGVMAEPTATIQRFDGSWETHSSWPDDRAVERVFHPTMAGALQPAATEDPAAAQSIVDEERTETDLTSSPDTTKPFRLAYLGTSLAATVRVSGTPRVRVEARVDSTSTPLSAILVDYGEATVRKPLDMTVTEMMTTSCTLQDFARRTGCAAPRDVETRSVTRQIVSRGSIDVKNRASLVKAEPLTPGATYDVEWELQPVEYLFPPGHRIGLVLSTNHTEYVARDPLAHAVSVMLDGTALVLPVVEPE